MTKERVLVGGREIPPGDIAAEAQNHPAPSAEAAWFAAAEALAIRQLLLDEALRLELQPGDARDAAGQALTREDALIDALLAAEIQTPEADPETCRRFYANNPERFVTPPLVEAEHILIETDPADHFAMGLAVGDARALIRQLQAEPARFADLARNHSACPSREQGGRLGQIQPGQLVQPVEEALFALDEDSLCPHPVRTRFGVHVIRSGRRKDGRQVPFETARELIVQYLEEASYRRAVAQYIGILADRAVVNGVPTIGVATSPAR